MSIERKLDLILEHLGIEYVPEKGEKRGRGWSRWKRENNVTTTGMIPDIPKEFTDFCQVNLDWDAKLILNEYRAFNDYWLGVPGQRGIKKDWLATWRNWCRKVDEKNNKKESTEWKPPK